MDIKRKYTLRPDSPDERDFDLTLEHPSVHRPIVDLRRYMPPVFDQGQLGSCTSQALAGMRQYFALKYHGDNTALSRLYIYWHEREIEGTIDEDSGAELRDGMKVLKKLGVCPEEYYPYNIEHFTDKPSPEAEAHAGAYKIKSYHRVRTLHELKTCLHHELPVAIGIVVYESFESPEVARTGIVPMPKYYEQQLGGHACLVVGYNDAEGYLIVRNSWGSEWGDKGYCYLPYDYYNEGLIVDMWTAYAD